MSNFEDTFGQTYYVSLGTIPTKIICYGVELRTGERINVSSNLILMISGNPGEIEYYRNFLFLIHQNTKLPVIGISNSGHNRLPANLKLPPIYENSKLYDLEAQIAHKKQFIDEYIDLENVKLYLLGHSIGGYMCLELMDRFSYIADKVMKAVLVMPSLDRMVETDMGKKVNIMFQNYSSPLICLATILDILLPERLKRYAVTRVLKQDSKLFQLDKQQTLPNCVISSATNLLQPNCLRALILMTLSEFRQVIKPNIDAMEKFHDKVTILYGENDHWAPVEYYNDLKASISDRVDARLCLEQIDHAFVIDRLGTETISTVVVNEILKNK